MLWVMNAWRLPSTVTGLRQAHKQHAESKELILGALQTAVTSSVAQRKAAGAMVACRLFLSVGNRVKRSNLLWWHREATLRRHERGHAETAMRLRLSEVASAIELLASMFSFSAKLHVSRVFHGWHQLRQASVATKIRIQTGLALH